MGSLKLIIQTIYLLLLSTDFEIFDHRFRKSKFFQTEVIKYDKRPKSFKAGSAGGSLG